MIGLLQTEALKTKSYQEIENEMLKPIRKLNATKNLKIFLECGSVDDAT